MWTIVPGHRIALILRKNQGDRGIAVDGVWGITLMSFYFILFFNVCDTLSLSLQLYCPDITVVVDWSLKINYLSV